MDNKGTVKNIFKVFGIILVLLALTAFAKAEIYNFDCDNTFNCSIKSYCYGVPGAVPGLLVGWGGAFSYITGVPGEGTQVEPITYNFTSNQPGVNLCKLTATTTAFASQDQGNESTTIYVNGVELATTADNYCNGPSSEGCLFCGEDTQNLGLFPITLHTNNTITFYGHDSHALVAATLDCQFINPGCEINAAPIINNISDKILHYTNESFHIDLWDYMNDYDHQLSELEVLIDYNTSLLNCTLDNNRFLSCTSKRVLGQTDFNVTVIDPCDESQSEIFTVTVTNNPPNLNVDDYYVSCVQDLNHLVDLWDFSYDEEIPLVDYTLLSQSNPTLMNCVLEDNRYISCDINVCSDNYTELTVEIEDIFGLTHIDPFRIYTDDFDPEWTASFPKRCFNESNYKFIDLRNYSYDLEDGNTNLDYSLTQSNSDALNCFIEDDYYVSCNNVSNLHEINNLTIKVIDSKGQFDTQVMEITSNCFNDENKHFEFTSPTKGICLEQCASYTTLLTIKNISGQRECFNFDLEYIGHFNVSLQNNSFCLNDNESTQMPLSANTCNADYSNYTVRVYDQDQNIELYYDYEIGSCNSFDGFRINEFDGKVCKGEERSFSVDITNFTSSNKEIFIKAENQMILLYFSKNKVYLDSGETETVDLIINAKHAPLGKYNILLGGDATNYHIEKRMELEIVDCSEIKERNFIIYAPEICYDVSRGQEFTGSFSVRRITPGCPGCNFNEQTIALQLIGMPNELSYNYLSLRRWEEREVQYTVLVPEDAPAGIQFLTIVGTEQYEGPFDDELGFADPQEICLNVQGESNSAISVRTQIKDIPWCDSEIFELEIINTGDFDEYFDLSTTNIPVGITASLSDSHVLVPKNGSVIVYVAISTNPNSIITDNQFITVNLDGNIDLSTKIYFNVISKPSFQDIEILSSTDFLALKTNSEGEYTLQIRNNSETEFTNLKISFENVPSDINIEEKIIDSIIPGQIILIKGKISVGNTEGYFEPSFVIEKTSTGIVLNKEKFTLFITSDENIFAGLFSLGSGLFAFGDTVGLFSLAGVNVDLVLPAFLILLLLVIILGVLIFDRRYQNELWVVEK